MAKKNSVMFFVFSTGDMTASDQELIISNNISQTDSKLLDYMS